MSEVGETSAPDLQKSGITLREILDVAMGFEQAANRFYLGLRDRVGADVRPLVDELAQEEQRHYELLAQLAADENLASQLAVTTLPPGPADASFRAYVTIAPLGDDPEADELLDYAANRERVAHEHYAYLAEVATPGPVQALFRHLRDEEKRHESFVDRLWTGAFSSL